MDQKLFREWLTLFNAWVSENVGVVALLLDNAPQHKPPEGYQKESLGNGLYGFEFGHISLVYLPPNYTSHIQPLDQGITRALKQRYKNRLLDWTLQELLKIDGNIDFSQHMSFNRESLPWLKQCWSEVGDSVFANCFRKAGILQENNCLQGDTGNIEEQESLEYSCATSQPVELEVQETRNQLQEQFSTSDITVSEWITSCNDQAVEIEEKHNH
jgi:hypothetical protein